MRVADIMTTDVLTVMPKTAVDRAIGLLAGHRYLALPVITATGELVGIVTEVDLLTSRFPHDPRAPRRAATVGEVMSQPVITATASADVRDLAESMWRHRHRNLPVVDDGRLVGFVTRTDLIQMLAVDRR